MRTKTSVARRRPEKMPILPGAGLFLAWAWLAIPGVGAAALVGGDPPETLGTPSAIDSSGTTEETVEVAAGAPLREAPEHRAGALAVIDFEMELPELERRGEWVRVRYGAFRGWVWTGDGPPAGSGGEPLPESDEESGAAAAPAPTPASVAASSTTRAPRVRMLERAREILGDRAAERDAGPWLLVTDVPDPGLLTSLEHLGSEVVRAYRWLYGLDPGLPLRTSPAAAVDGSSAGAAVPAKEDREVVVLFERKEDFRRLGGSGGAPAVVSPAGQAGFGVAALSRGGRASDAVRSLFVHETVHLINRRTLGTRAPAWLEEGLAAALAVSRIDPDGTIHPEILGGAVRRLDEYVTASGEERVKVELTGGLSGLELVTKALERGELPTLERLVSLPWGELDEPEARPLLYAEAALFVRFLLIGDRERWRDGFHDFLQGVMTGRPAEPEHLLRALGAESWEVLEARFHRDLRWLGLTG